MGLHFSQEVVVLSKVVLFESDEILAKFSDFVLLYLDDPLELHNNQESTEEMTAALLEDQKRLAVAFQEVLSLVGQLVYSLSALLVGN